MNKREVVRTVLSGERPPYVPWSFSFTEEAAKRLQNHLGPKHLEEFLDNHLLGLGSDVGFFEDVGNGCVRDVFGVVWDRSVDKDIGIVKTPVLPAQTLSGYTFPDPADPRFYDNIPTSIERYPDRFRVFCIGFSLFERAWTLRGMANLMIDFLTNPGFVHELLDTIVEYNLRQVEEALRYDIDAVYFGDDWGQQNGLIMGPECWCRFLRPRLSQMYGAVKDAGKFVFIHSCGDVDELFDDLVGLGVDCFNPFQPEVMDVWSLLPCYRGRLTFHGGLSTQKTLPAGTVEDVRAESRRLLELGKEGSYIFAPAHAVEGDVPVENILAFIEEAQKQRAHS